MTWEEFQQQKLGVSQNCSATTNGSHKLSDAILPPWKDWREEGIVSPVKAPRRLWILLDFQVYSIPITSYWCLLHCKDRAH
ncbi:Thiol protease aleurain [Thalictrum thalictroides]|uniref:Thiol protease aleurain n=1 Tax=Thalictrum thalictroides TaxID=46969 RepID=A0A7J6V4L8_THATH|nr:Thiol protease aleurain [Thalictrum thalictroides]